MEGANRYLTREFIPQHNRRFSRLAKEPDPACRPVPKGLKLKDIFCLKKERTVAADNTISYKGKFFQILPDEYRLSSLKAKVEVHEHLDGSLHIFYQGKKLKHKPISKKKTKSDVSVFRQKGNKLVAITY